VKDEVAHDRVALRTAAVIENVGRRDLDVIEEAKAVDRLVAECGNTDRAALPVRSAVHKHLSPWAAPLGDVAERCRYSVARPIPRTAAISLFGVPASIICRM
jgi:hypothetical protein